MSPAQSGASETLGLGQPAPGFMARNQYGELLTVGGLRGAPAVIIFYPWAFSSICRDELAAIRDDHERFVALRTRVLAVSCDAMYTLRAYADAEGIPFDLLERPLAARCDRAGVWRLRRRVGVRAAWHFRVGLRRSHQMATGQPDQ